MKTFDDFDAWGAAVSGANLRLVCDGVETRSWSIGAVDLGGVLLQVANEGGGTLCYGGTTHPGPMLFLPLTHEHEHVVNGERLDADSLFAIPRGADFRITVRKRAHSWCSIALPFEVTAPWPAGSASGTITCGAGAVPRLRGLVGEITSALIGRPAGTAAHLAAGRDLVAAAIDCLPARPAAQPRLGRPRLDRAEIVRRAMAMIDDSAIVPTAAELAQGVGVTHRTLLRTFRETFGVPPRHYLMLRELHAVRRALLQDGGRHATVADVLTAHGVWEFGRFARRYREQFGEPPSETLRRARG